MNPRVLLVLLIFCTVLSVAVFPAYADEAVTDELLHEALLSDRLYSKDVEFWSEAHHILGTKRDGTRVEVYLAASVGGYGFMGGGFMMQSGWIGPCTVVLRQIGSKWSFVELKQIEAFNEMPSIMPQAMIAKYHAYTDNSDIQRQKKEQVQAYLDSIGRTEPIIQYADLDAPLSNMLTCAGNFRLCVDGDYPLINTTMECLEDGESYLYTRAWQMDANGVIDPQYTTAEHGTLMMNGTTGTETLTKSRKTDGEILETTTILVEQYRLTITLEDAGGSACYVLDFDGWEYHQPTVTRKGQCGISTVQLDAYASKLPGKRQSVLETEDQVTFGDDERFTLLRDGSLHTLVYSRLENGVWVEGWRNEKLLPSGSMTLYMNAYEADATTVHEYGRFSCLLGDTLGIYAGEEHPELAVSISRNEADCWQVATYSSSMTGLYAYLFEDCILTNQAELTALQTAGIWFGGVDTDAATFDPQVIWTAKDELKEKCGDAPEIQLFAGAEPLYMNLGLELRLPVYVLPNNAAPRAADGKATVSFEDWVIALCKREEWMMVLYETSDNHYRTGWVNTNGNWMLAKVCDLTMPALFEENQTASVKQKTLLLDDPVNESGEILMLKADTKVTILWEGDSLSYVETLAQNDVWRGFVSTDQLQ